MSLMQAAQQEISERMKRIVSLRQEIILEEEAINKAEMVLAFLQGQGTLPIDKLNSRPTIGNITEKLLRKAGNPVHTDEIQQELERNELPTNRKTLLTSLREDKRKRFINLGDSRIDLNPTPLDLAPRPKKDKMNTGLMAAIRDAVQDLNGQEFTIKDVRENLIEKHPKIGEKTKDNYASVSAVLNKMFRDGKLQIIRKGTGSEPNLYKKLVEKVAS